MKKIILTLMVTLMMAGVAFAVPVLPSGFNYVSSPYWTITDGTTGVDGTVITRIEIEQAAYESDFGMFAVNDIVNPTSIDYEFQIFAHTEEVAALSNKTVYFKEDAGAYSVSLDQNIWQDFSNSFGFYFGVHTGGATDPSADYKYYTDSQFNNPDPDVEHILMAFDGASNAIFYLDDQPVAGADLDYLDMVVSVNDVAPVPEPGTLLLLGGGLLGMVYLRKRNKA